MLRSQSFDHQGSITILVQLLLIGVHNQTPHGQVHRMHRHTGKPHKPTDITIYGPYPSIS